MTLLLKQILTGFHDVAAQLFEGTKPQKASSRVARPSQGPKKAYIRPELRQINREQATLILSVRAWEGDAEASAFLAHLFPHPSERNDTKDVA